MYNEDQMLPLPLLILVIVLSTSVFIAPLVFAWHAGRFSPGMFWVIIAPIAITFLIMSLRLKTSLDDVEITVRIWPFPAAQLKYTDIRKVEEIEYSPMADFGGWGIRYGLGGKIYSMRGSQALKLSLSSGKIVYLGTQEPRKLSAEIKAHLVAQ
ncbi:hypothetical protein [Sphingobium mellinum]|uniref:hypothetical protein n=1 Tax=Sphingobium mellinum TaxID=1387166 RepID=UPI0030ED64DD